MTPDSADPQQLEWTDDLIKVFWDYQSRFPENYFTSLYGEQIAKSIQKYVSRNSRILDYACGIGSLTGHLLQAGFSVAGCDLSPESVTYVQKTFETQTKFKGAFTMSDLLTGSQQFDAVVLVELIEHVNDNVLTQVMKDLHQILSPSGVIIVTTPNDEDLDVETVYCPCCNHTFHRWQHVRSWNANSLAKSLAAYGFTNVATQEVDFSLSPKNGIFRYLIHRILRKLLHRKQPHLIGVFKKY